MEAIKFLTRNSFPNNMNFLLETHLKEEYASLLQDVQDSGSFLGLDAVLNARDPQEKINIIKATFEMYRESKIWLDDFNILMHLLTEVAQMSNFEDILSFTSNNFRPILNCESVHIWLVDSELGCFYTFNENRKKIQAYLNQALFGKLILTEGIINAYHQDKLPLYKSLDNDEIKYVDGAILIPLIYTSTKIDIFLEISSFAASGQGNVVISQKLSINTTKPNSMDPAIFVGISSGGNNSGNNVA